MELPDFDYLLSLAKENPEELENLRNRYNQALIDSAPEPFKKRLHGLLFKIDMEKRRSKNSIQYCVTISKMMMDSFSELQEAIDHLRHVDTSKIEPVQKFDNIISFPSINSEQA